MIKRHLNEQNKTIINQLMKKRIISYFNPIIINKQMINSQDHFQWIKIEFSNMYLINKHHLIFILKIFRKI